MKQTIDIDGCPLDCDGESLLGSVAHILTQHRLTLDSLVWTALGEPREVRVWMSVEGDEAQINACVEDCLCLAGIRYVSQGGTNKQARILSRLKPLESRPSA
jgi:hypothetical protein